jgi:cytochrome c-type biogenesis protein CcmH
LGITYIQLQHLRGALEALGRAYELNSQSPELRMAYARAMILTRDPNLSQSGARLLRGVLETNPHHQGALMLLGFSAFNGRNYGEAIEIWRRLLAMRDPDGEGARLLRNSIARAEELQSEQASAEPPATEPAAQTPSITVTVDLAPELREQFSPRDTLFVFAKAASGPPMPLAAVRQPAEGFPVRVVLDDGQAMMPEMRLSKFQRVTVGARISKGAGVAAEAGDLKAVSASLNLNEGSQAVALTIDRVVRE